VSIDDDPACAAARGEETPDSDTRTLTLIFSSPVADSLVKIAALAGYHLTLVEPDADRATPDGVRAVPGLDKAGVDGATDVVVTDHDRPELGEMLRDALALRPRWVGVMGSVRHVAPHLSALRELGVAEEEIARVHRPIGLNIGSRTPSEIALATVAGLIADRNRRPGGFVF
jgi:xanthine dehydrogenase accessory factor